MIYTKYSSAVLTRICFRSTEKYSTRSISRTHGSNVRSLNRSQSKWFNLLENHAAYIILYTNKVTTSNALWRIANVLYRIDCLSKLTWLAEYNTV